MTRIQKAKTAPKVQVRIRQDIYIGKREQQHQAALVSHFNTPWEEFLDGVADSCHSAEDRKYIASWKRQHCKKRKKS